ncbi:MAG TPA: amidohydrolase family protein [Chitinophagaceae bacterium]|nr:amidohydrolase family protein [Chitinophagaceae bacterium]
MEEEVSIQSTVEGAIDTHVHFWKYDKIRDAWITDNMKTLQQDYLPQTLISTLKRNGVDGCVAVQADQSELETLFLVELAKTHSIIKGVVGWVDLQNENLEERLQYFSQYPIIKGWRHIVQGEPDDFLIRPAFQRGVSALQPYNYTYDVLIYPRQLKAALEFVGRFPGQKLVIDHCAKPDIAGKKIDDWAGTMKEIAKHPNVYCKLSGLFTEAKWKHWSPGEFYPYLDVVFDAFSTDRLLFGSDWPVILLSGMYVQWKSLLEKYMENFDREEKAKVFGKNAIRFYNL